MVPAELLKQIYLFRGASPEDLATLAAITEPKDLLPGQSLFRSGDPADAMFYIEMGTVEIVRPGTESVFATLGTGQTVGDRRPSRLFLLLVLAVLTVRLAALWLHTSALETGSLALWTVVGLVAAASAARFAMHGTAVSGEHLYAALSAYLLAGVFFGVLYWTIERAWGGSFAVAGAAVRPGGFSPGSAIYFSFVTLATLGYGDMVPVSEVTRGLAIVQAVAGQLYLAVMVARLVSLYVRGSQKGEGS